MAMTKYGTAPSQVSKTAQATPPTPAPTKDDEQKKKLKPTK